MLHGAGRLAALAVVCAAALAGGQEPAAQPAVPIVPIAQHVYAAIQPDDARFNESNSLLILQDDHAIVVDSQAGPSATRAFIAEIRKLTPHPVRFVISTHFHGDHTQTTGEYLAVWPAATVIMHDTGREDVTARTIPDLRKELAEGDAEVEAAEKRLAAGVSRTGVPLTDEQKASNRRQIDALTARLAERRGLEVPLPSLTYAREMTLHGRVPVRLLHVRAHTRGDTIVYLPEQRVLATGDVLDDLPFGGHGYPSSWVGALNALEQLEFDRVVPGHGRIREGKTHLRLVRDLFDSIVAQVKEAVAAGRSLDETKKSVDLLPFRSKLVTDERAGRAFDAWMPETVERAYLEATGKLDSER